MSNKVVYVSLNVMETHAGRLGRMQYAGNTPVVTLRNWTKVSLRKPENPSQDVIVLAVSVDEALLRQSGDDLIIRWGTNPNPQPEDYQVFEFRPARMFLDGEAPSRVAAEVPK